MAKLTKTAPAAHVPTPAVPEPVHTNSVPAQATSGVDAPKPAVHAPFTVEPVNGAHVPGASAPNMVQKRAERIQKAIEGGAPFTYKEERKGKFNCICGSPGENQHVCLNKHGQEIVVGSTCLKYLEDHAGKRLEPPKKERVRKAGTAAPGVSRQQKLTAVLSQYTAPFKFVRKQDGPFTCVCGGSGSKQIVISDVNGVEFVTGETCAEHIPGVVIPKPESKRKAPKERIAGLKGGVTSANVPKSPPDFSNVG